MGIRYQEGNPCKRTLVGDSHANLAAFFVHRDGHDFHQLDSVPVCVGDTLVPAIGRVVEGSVSIFGAVKVGFDAYELGKCVLYNFLRNLPSFSYSMSQPKASIRW